MTSARLLATWRDRWSKAHGAALLLPYLGGQVSYWIGRLTRSQFWTIPGALMASVAGCLAFMLISPAVMLSLNGQILLAWLLLAYAVLARRYEGPVIALLMVGLSVIASTRYLSWRLYDTLPTHLGADLFWGLALWTTEALAWLLLLLRLLSRHWPLQQPMQALPQEALQWPTVDVIVTCKDEPLDAIEHCLERLHAQSWPANKLRLHLSGAFERAELAELAQRWEASWQVVGAGWPLLLQHAWLQKNEGELILWLDSPMALPPDALTSSAGWMLRDASLALLSGPDGLWTPLRSMQKLMPAPMRRRMQAMAAAQEARGHGLAWVQGAALRQLVAKGELRRAYDAPKELMAAGYVCAWLLPQALFEPESLEDAQAGAQGAQEPSRLVRVDPPQRAPAPLRSRLASALRRWLGASLHWRWRAHALQTGLQFYAPVARGVFWLTPLLCLGMGWRPVETSLLALTANIAPHLLLGQLAWQAQQPSGRMPFRLLLREWLLQGVLMGRTCRAFLSTQWRYLWGRWRAQASPRLPDPSLPSSLIVRESANLAVHALVLLHLWRSPPAAAEWSRGLTLVYLLWALVQVLQSLSRLAMAKEELLVSRQTSQRALQSVMLSAGPRRLVSGVCLNFPQTELQIRCAPQAAAGLGVGERISMSIFHRRREYTYAVQLQECAADGQMLKIKVAASDLADYQAFGAAIFSRETDWPAWLPGRRADQILPDWAHRLYDGALGLFYNFVISKNAMQTIRRKLRDALPAWLQAGNETHG